MQECEDYAKIIKWKNELYHVNFLIQINFGRSTNCSYRWQNFAVFACNCFWKMHYLHQQKTSNDLGKMHYW